MLNEALLRQISDTGELLGLDEAVIEKDYYVPRLFMRFLILKMKLSVWYFVAALVWLKHISLCDACQRMLISRCSAKQQKTSADHVSKMN